MNLRSVAFVAAAAIALSPMAAQAVPISGKVGLTGIVDTDNSTFSADGSLDFNPEFGKSVDAVGDFAVINTVLEAGDDTLFTFNDLGFTPGEVIWEGGGFSFTATAFRNFDHTASGLAFVADGIINSSLAGFDPTPGLFELSTQGIESLVSFSSTTTATPVPLPASVFLMFGALAGLGVLTRHRKAAA